MSVRQAFATALLDRARANPDIILISCDMGYDVLDEFQQSLPEQFYNVGAAEQSGLGIAVGFALRGKLPFVYTITSFCIYRPFEWLRNYLHNEKIKVVLVGTGVDDEYGNAGFTHHSFEVKAVMQALPNIRHFVPNETEVSSVLDTVIAASTPAFIQLHR